MSRQISNLIPDDEDVRKLRDAVFNLSQKYTDQARARNLRYRNKLETEKRENINSLSKEEESLKKEISRLKHSHSSLSYDIKGLQRKIGEAKKALSLDQETLKERRAARAR